MYGQPQALALPTVAEFNDLDTSFLAITEHAHTMAYAVVVAKAAGVDDQRVPIRPTCFG
jgi:hypothetical protein